ncbi:putative quinol monooxygenase [Sphingomonas sp. SRS2]|uniref:putative quinol monooxygenase n=1 Tax=Sphingomonas sp. SRS2 TaxID=133190 RepID=UPI000A8C6A2A|nr:antibiotic biosynthesis monooxygenase [Sphingomonas sp. SRS2]
MAKIFTQESAFICKFVIKEGRREEFLSVFNGLWQSFIDVMERDTNFMFYGWARNPNELVLIESWKSQEATEQVRNTERFKEAIPKMIDCCSEPMTLQMLSGLESDRSIFDAFPAGASSHHPSSGELETQFL